MYMEGTEFYQTASSFCPQLIGAEKRHYSDNNNCNSNAPTAGDHFVVEEFLNFSNDDDAPVLALDGESSTTVTAVGSCNSSSFSGCGGEPSFVPDANNLSGDLCVPYDDLAELEWLSNIVEESFSSEDLQRLQLISGITARFSADESATNSYSSSSGAAAAPVPAKARSKRSRAPPCNWTSRLLLLSSSSSNHHNSPGNFSPETTTSDDSSSEAVVSAQAHPHPPPPPPPAAVAAGGKKPSKSGVKKKEKEAGAAEGGSVGGGEGRRCLHCATDKTPQWRTGPMGPKTLCNACGVRYKSGRLVPEYRPAASPTFMLTKHSNSHRKVLELRRQKDFMRAHQQQQHQQFVHHHHHNGGMVFDHHAPPQGSMIGEDYLIHHHHQHQHVGPDYRQII